MTTREGVAICVGLLLCPTVLVKLIELVRVEED